MTPEDIEFQLLKVQRAELRRLREEIVAYPPANAELLLRACRTMANDIDTKLLRHANPREGCVA